MGKQKNLQLLKLSSLSLLHIGMAGCTDSTLCHLQWYPVPMQESVWTPQDTLYIDLPESLQEIKKAKTCAWHIEAAGDARYGYRAIDLAIGLATDDTIYWQKVQLQPDSALVSNVRHETFGRTIWRQEGNLLHKANVGNHPQDSLRRVIVLPSAETHHINDIGLCVQRRSARK